MQVPLTTIARSPRDRLHPVAARVAAAAGGPSPCPRGPTLRVLRLRPAVPGREQRGLRAAAAEQC
eukprot:841332-Pelagomonas_calceolata.AAC.2